MFIQPKINSLIKNDRLHKVNQINYFKVCKYTDVIVRNRPLNKQLQGKSRMSYLHVTIKTKSSDGWLCIFKDLTVSDIKQKFVKPYRLGKPIYYDGNILPPNEVTQIKINETEKTHEDELKIVQDESYKAAPVFEAL